MHGPPQAAESESSSPMHMYELLCVALLYVMLCCIAWMLARACVCVSMAVYLAARNVTTRLKPDNDTTDGPSLAPSLTTTQQTGLA